MKGIQPIASLILALSFLIVGLLSLFFGNVPVAASFIITTAIFVLLSLHSLISEQRHSAKKTT